MYDSKLIVFCCNWSVYPGLQLSSSEFDQEDVSSRVIVNMCSGRLDPELILQAFNHGASGVMVACCPPDECEHHGNYKAFRRISLLKKLLREMGIEPERLRVERVGTGEAPKLKKAIAEFESQLGKPSEAKSAA